MEFICKKCNSGFSSAFSLHKHLSVTERMSQKEYYEEYYPRYDAYNGKLIPFKADYKKYSAQNFIDKKSEFSFILKNGLQNNLAKNTILEQLKDCSKKSNGRLPNYCEWRSSKNLRYDKMANGGILNDFIELFQKEIKGTSVFDYFPEKIEINKSCGEILIDTREQKPLFDGEKTTINVGDYTLSKENYNGVHVDRKSKADFISTLTGGISRFKKECVKAKVMNIDLVVLVEESFSECFRYRPLKFTKQIVTGENAFHGLRQITREFDNVQFLFVENRDEARKYIKIVLNNKELVKKYDLQFLYEIGGMN